MASNRLKAQIRAAVEAGEESQRFASNPGRFLRRGARRIKLLNADEGLLGLPKPSLYAYGSPLIDGKWVESFDGGRVLVRRKMADGTWRPTKAGEAYFRHAKDEWIVHAAGRTMRRGAVRTG